MHGDARVDDYYWLRDDSRKDSEVGSCTFHRATAANCHTDLQFSVADLFLSCSSECFRVSLGVAHIIRVCAACKPRPQP